MAEIKWSNVDGSALNGAVSNANSAVNNYVRTLFGIGSNVEDFTDKLQKRSDETAKWNRNQNTQQIINQMNNTDSLEALQQLQSQGVGNAQNALNQFNGQVDLAALNEAKNTWAVDTEKRANAQDSLLDYSPKQKELMSEIQNDILTGNIEAAQAKLNSSNFSNKEKSNLVNSIYKAQENNRDFNLKYADTAGRYANSALEVEKAKAEIQKYENDFYANNGRTKVSTALLQKDPTYQKLQATLQALGQSSNLLKSQLDMFGSNSIVNGGKYAPRLPTDIEPSVSTGSINSVPEKAIQEATSVQQALPTETPDSATSVAERVAQVATNPLAKVSKPQTEEDFKEGLADAGFAERVGSTIPPALQPTYNNLINGEIDINSENGKKNLALLEAHINDNIKTFNKQTGSNIQPVTLPTTQVGLADWKRKMASRKEALSQEHQVALNDVFGIKHTNNPNDIDPAKNILKYALTESEYSKDDAKYQTQEDVIEALKQDKYAKQGWFDGNDLQERAVKLLDRFEPKEVMRIINSVKSNGTREVNGMFNPFQNDEYAAIDNLIRNVDKDPNLLQDLRNKVEDIKKVNDNKVNSLSMIIPIGQAASVDASARNAYGKEYVESKHAISRKVDSEVKAKQAVEALKQKAEIAETNTSINKAAEELPADTLKALLEDGTLDTATQIKAYVALGNKVPNDLDEKELDKIRDTLLELPAEELKKLIQSKVNTTALKKEADSLQKELKDKDLLTSDLESKLKSIN